MRLRIAVLAVFLAAVCVSDGEAQTTTVTDNSPPEAKLVSIDRQSTRVPTRLVRYYGRLLDRLDRKCTEPRTRISDMAVKGVQLLEEDKGVSMSNREMLEAMDESMPEGSASLNLQCSEIVALLVTMIDRR